MKDFSQDPLTFTHNTPGCSYCISDARVHSEGFDRSFGGIFNRDIQLKEKPALGNFPKLLIRISVTSADKDFILQKYLQFCEFLD